MTYVIVKRDGWHEVWFSPYQTEATHRVYERRVAMFREAFEAQDYAQKLEQP